MGLPALSTNQQIGSFGCTTFELVKKAAALKAPSPPRVPALVAREDESGATAPLPQPAESSQARRAEPRVATASCFHFDEFSASMYKVRNMGTHVGNQITERSWSWNWYMHEQNLIKQLVPDCPLSAGTVAFAGLSEHNFSCLP